MTEELADRLDSLADETTRAADALLMREAAATIRAERVAPDDAIVEVMDYVASKAIGDLAAELVRIRAERDAARATITEARARLHAASIPPGVSELAFAEATIRDARAILYRGAADIT